MEMLQVFTSVELTGYEHYHADKCTLIQLLLIRDTTYRFVVERRFYLRVAVFHCSWSVEAFGYMGVDLQWMRTGVGMRGRVMGKFPVKGAIIVDPTNSKLTVRMEPPTEVNIVDR